MSLKKKVLVACATLGLAPAAFAEGDSTSYTVPQTVSNAITKLSDAGDKFAAELIPMIIGVGLAFLGGWFAVKIFKWFRRAA